MHITTSRSFPLLLVAAIAALAASPSSAQKPDPTQEFEPAGLQERYDESIRRAAYTPYTDDAYLLLQSVLPGFAGMVYSPDGRLEVSLTEEGSPAQAAEVIADFFAARAGHAGAEPEKPELNFRTVEIDWGSLLEHRDAISPVAGELGIALLDADESCNCVRIGLEDADRESSIREYAYQAGIPARMLHFQKVQKAHLGQSLIDEFRPVIGATRVRAAGGSRLGWSFIGPCTGTATAVMAGSGGLLMASHCSVAFATADRGVVRQNGTFPSVRGPVATETVDPPLVATLPGCPAGSVCRFSDAAFAAFTDPAHGHALGDLAVPQGFPCTAAPCSAPLVMRRWGDRLRITRVGAAPIMGERKVKIGQVSGATEGQVDATCFDTAIEPNPVTPVNTMLLCQSRTTGQFGPGDSGAPVVSDLGAAQVQIDGLAWGFNAPSRNSPLSMTSTIFTPIGLVTQELGAMQFVPNPPPPPPPARPDYCQRALALCRREIGSAPIITAGYCQREYNACRRSGIP